MEKVKELNKTAMVSSATVTAEDLAKINQYTLKQLSAEDVFVFKVMMADNETDDRNYEPLTRKALDDMVRLYPGITVLKDHHRSADTQVGRIFDTWIEEDPMRKTEAGEIHAEAHAKIYINRTSTNADLIADLEAGIKSEVSTGTVPEHLVCSICGADQMETWCSHWPGESYTVNGEKKLCQMTITDIKSARELSLVAVPAQPRAGTHKAEAELKKETDTPDASIVDLRIRMTEAFLNIQKGDNENE